MQSGSLFDVVVAAQHQIHMERIDLFMLKTQQKWENLFNIKYIILGKVPKK